MDSFLYKVQVSTKAGQVQNWYQRLNQLGFILNELDHLVICVPDEEETDSIDNVRAFAEECTRLLASISAVKNALAAHGRFFTDANLSCLPYLMSREADQWIVRQVTRRQRREAV